MGDVIQFGRAQRKALEHKEKKSKLKARKLAQAHRDKIWARMRKHSEDSMMYEIQTLGTEEATRRVNEAHAKLGQLVDAEKWTIGLTIAALAQYLSRTTRTLEVLESGALVPCPKCEGGSKKPEGTEPCEECKGAAFIPGGKG